jgi:mRNA-degrading endonuclease toxin of MazEF toxin-antitoxin module
LARFPFTNQIDYKIRPVLIVSNNSFNARHSFCWAIPITSKSRQKEFEIEIHPTEFTSRLQSQSFIRTDRISAMEKHLFLKEIGKITPALYEEVKKAIIHNF